MLFRPSLSVGLDTTPYFCVRFECCEDANSLVQVWRTKELVSTCAESSPNTISIAFAIRIIPLYPKEIGITPQDREFDMYGLSSLCRYKYRISAISQYKLAHLVYYRRILISTDNKRKMISVVSMSRKRDRS